MYCDDALIENNRLLRQLRRHLPDVQPPPDTCVHNTIADNRGPSGYGIGLKDMDDAVIVDNLFLDNRVGAYLDSSPREMDSIGVFSGNVFAYNDIGVEMMPSVQRNMFSGNSFIDNEEQVAVVRRRATCRATRWTVDGHGNYWSDYAGYDADGDGLGDMAYGSERLFENLMQQEPQLRLFLYSPATNAIDFAARAFPVVKPKPKLVDERPFMTPMIPAGAPPLPGPDNSRLALAGRRPDPGRPGPGRAAAPEPAALLSARQTAAEPPIMNEMITVTNITKRFGGLTAVDDLSFTVQAGQAVALWGANGAGKTTALRCLLNLIPFEGHITMDGLDVAQQGKAARRLIGFVPQELNFHDDMTVAETLTVLRPAEESARRL